MESLVYAQRAIVRFAIIMDGLKKLYAHLMSRGATPSAKRPLAWPGRDWAIILYTSAVALTGLAIFAGVLFWQEQASIGLPAPTATEQMKLSQAALEAMLARYQSLASEHTLLLKSPPPIADPSQSK